MPWNALYPHWVQYLSQKRPTKFIHTESYFRLDWLGVALWLWLNEDGTIIIFNRFLLFWLRSAYAPREWPKARGVSRVLKLVCAKSSQGKMGWQHSNWIAFICVLSLNTKLATEVERTLTRSPNWSYLRSASLTVDLVLKWALAVRASNCQWDHDPYIVIFRGWRQIKSVWWWWYDLISIYRSHCNCLNIVIFYKHINGKRVWKFWNIYSAFG